MILSQIICHLVVVISDCVATPQYYTQYCTCGTIHISVSVLTCNLHSTIYISGVPITFLWDAVKQAGTEGKYSKKPHSKLKPYFCLHKISYRPSRCMLHWLILILDRDCVCLLYRIENLLFLLFPFFSIHIPWPSPLGHLLLGCGLVLETLGCQWSVPSYIGCF